MHYGREIPTFQRHLLTPTEKVVVGQSEMLASSHKTTHCHILEDNHLYIQ
jgi:hypothetical protein